MFWIGETKSSMICYDADFRCKELERSFEKLSNDKSGRTQDGYMHNFVIGTYYNYSITLSRGPNCTDAKWDTLWDIVSKKCPSYFVKVPYNQGNITFQCYITSGSQKAKKIRKGNFARWGEIQLKIVANNPCSSTGKSDASGNYVYQAGVS